jgi:hypothetical protein
MDVQIKSRPTECCLCSVNLPSIPLPMHPLYDNHGMKGRQIILHANKIKPVRSAWCHSLCAQVITSNKPTSGCIYAVDIQGYYADAEGLKNEADTLIPNDIRTINEDLLQRLAEHSHIIGDDGFTHFAIVLENDVLYPDEANRLRNFRTNIHHCIICGKSDKKHGCLRVPIQCTAGSPWEHKIFRCDHRQSLGDDTCTQPMHVGCAMWWIDPTASPTWPTVRRVFFYPSPMRAKYTEEPAIGHVYCDLHVKDLKLKANALQCHHPPMAQRPWKEEAVETFSNANDAEEIPGVHDSPNGVVAADGKGEDSPTSRKRPLVNAVLGDSASDAVADSLDPVVREAVQEVRASIRSKLNDMKDRYRQKVTSDQEFKELWGRIESAVDKEIPNPAN